MTDKISDQPEGSTPLEDISGLLRDDITTREQLDEAESLNIINAVEWLERGRCQMRRLAKCQNEVFPPVRNHSQ